MSPEFEDQVAKFQFDSTSYKNLCFVGRHYIKASAAAKNLKLKYPSKQKGSNIESRCVQLKGANSIIVLGEELEAMEEDDGKIIQFPSGHLTLEMVREFFGDDSFIRSFILKERDLLEEEIRKVLLDATL